MSKAYQHLNRMGDAYFLQSKRGKAGQLQYTFARKLTGTPVERVPEGYEPRENPESGQVTLRRIKPSAIRAEEKQLLEQAIRTHAKGLPFIVDMEDRSLVVYTSDMDAGNAEERINFLREMLPMDAAAAGRMKADILANARYARMMRFTLIDAENRLFNMDRWCFRGSIDDWYFIAGNTPLAGLAEKYVGHLGKESFFELM